MIVDVEGAGGRNGEGGPWAMGVAGGSEGPDPEAGLRRNLLPGAPGRYDPRILSHRGEPRASYHGCIRVPPPTTPNPATPLPNPTQRPSARVTFHFKFSGSTQRRQEASTTPTIPLLQPRPTRYVNPAPRPTHRTGTTLASTRD